MEGRRYWIEASRCNDCVGYYDEPQCVAACPIDDCCIPLVSDAAAPEEDGEEKAMNGRNGESAFVVRSLMEEPYSIPYIKDGFRKGDAPAVIYLDNNATTRIAEEVLEEALPYLTPLR